MFCITSSHDSNLVPFSDIFSLRNGQKSQGWIRGMLYLARKSPNQMQRMVCGLSWWRCHVPFITNPLSCPLCLVIYIAQCNKGDSQVISKQRKWSVHLGFQWSQFLGSRCHWFCSPACLTWLPDGLASASLARLLQKTLHMAKSSIKMKCTKSILILTSSVSSHKMAWWFCMTKVLTWSMTSSLQLV